MIISREKLRKALTQRLNLEAVKDLYFDFELDPENQPTVTKDGLLRELLKLLWDQNKLDELVKKLEEERPDIDLKDIYFQHPNPAINQVQAFVETNRNLLIQASIACVIVLAILLILPLTTQCFSYFGSETLRQDGERVGPLIRQNGNEFFIWYDDGKIFVENQNSKVREYDDPRTYESRNQWVPLPNTPISICVDHNFGINFRFRRILALNSGGN